MDYFSTARIVSVSDQTTTTVGQAFPNQPLPVNDEFLSDKGYVVVREGVPFNPATQKLVAIDSPVMVDGQYQVVEAVALGAPELLIRAKAARLSGLGAAYASKVSAGLVVGGSRYQIDDAAQANMTAVQTKFLKGATDAHGGYWRTDDNQNVLFNDADVQTLFDAVYNYKLTIIRATQAAKDAIMAAPTVDAVMAVNISLNE